jgi:hypothetical protein
MLPSYLLKLVGFLLPRNFQYIQLSTGLSSRKASFLASGVSGIINFVCTIPAQLWLVDRWGRRPSCITGGLVMCLCMTLIGVMYASGLVKEAGGRWVVVILIYVSAIIPFSNYSFDPEPHLIGVRCRVSSSSIRRINTNNLARFSMTWAVAGKVRLLYGLVRYLD